MRTLQCQFKGTTRHYNYLYTGKKDVKIGDHAVVHSNGEFSIVQVKGIRAGVDKAVTKPVIAVLTQPEFEKYQEDCGRIGEYRSAFDELDHLIQEEKRLEKYREFAKDTTNPRAKELMDKINGFIGVPLLNTSSDEERVTREDIEKARPVEGSATTTIIQE